MRAAPRARLVRWMLLLAIPAAALGAMAAAGVVLVLREEPTDPVEEPPREERPTRPPRGRGARGERLQEIRAHVAADDADVAAFQDRLSSPEPAERLEAARDLLLRGGDVLRWLHRVEPAHAEGRALVSKVEGALAKLRRIEAGADYGRLDAETRLEVRLAELRRALPDEMLLGEELAYWRAKVEGDRRRLADGVGEPGELAYAELQFAAARRRKGEIDDAQWAQERDRLLPAVTAWIDSLRGRRDVSPDRLAKLEERLASLP